jgi:hypothetical protein
MRLPKGRALSGLGVVSVPDGGLEQQRCYQRSWYVGQVCSSAAAATEPYSYTAMWYCWGKNAPGDSAREARATRHTCTPNGRAGHSSSAYGSRVLTPPCAWETFLNKCLQVQYVWPIKLWPTLSTGHHCHIGLVVAGMLLGDTLCRVANAVRGPGYMGSCC